MTDEAEAMQGMARCLVDIINSGLIPAILRGEINDEPKIGQ